MSDTPLAEFLTPISSGMEPAPADAGRLSPERRAALDDALRDLAVHRAAAEAASRSYVVHGGQRV